MNRYLAVLGAMVVVIAAPILLKPRESARSADYRPEDRLVVVTPHVETIRYELERGFQQWMQERHGRRVVIDWRIPGGTSDIIKVLKSEYTAAFENEWTRGGNEVAAMQEFADAKSESPARQAFLRSSVGVGIDLMLGGGPIDYNGLRKQGFIVSRDEAGHGPEAVRKAHPEWFTDAVIPAKLAGQELYEPGLAWVGTCLSAFGICWNEERREALGIPGPPATWSDLASPAWRNQIALADPTKSGTVAAMFEVILQIEMQRAAAEAGQDEARRAAAVAEGWQRGLRLIQRIAANSRYWTDSSTKIPLDVADGEAVAGICVDFYGRNFVERLERTNGVSRLRFVAPPGETTVSPQPVAMLRGAPHAELATRFIEYLLTPEAQRLWGWKAGVPGGPEKMALRNMPIRKDYYVEANLKEAADPALRPLEDGIAFQYDPRLTADLFSTIRVIIRAMCIDPHHELREAWAMLADRGFPAEATARFGNLEAVNYTAAAGIAAKLKSRDPVMAATVARDLSVVFRGNYRKAMELAAAGR
jgi:ABC-type Fe3+ transport system substrate-binding protein